MTGPPIEEVGPAHVFEAASGGGHGVGSLPLADLARENRNSGTADVPSSASSRIGLAAPSADRNSGGRRRGPINRTHLTLRSVLWRPAAGWPKAPPNPTIRESAVEATDSRGQIGNRSSESLSSGLRGRSSCRGCSETEP